MEKSKSTKTTFTSYQKLLIVVLALLQFTVILDFMVLSPLGDILMKSLNMTPTGFGLVVSGYAFSAGASGILAAGFADKFDRKKLLVFFYIGFILGTLSCAMANSYWMLLLARIVTGLFGGVIGSIAMAIITDVFEVNQRGRVIGYVQMAFALSQILGIPMGLYFANLWGWHSSFLMIVLLATALLLVIMFTMKPVSGHLQLQTDKKAFLHLWHTLTNKSYATGFLATAFLAIGGFMLMPFGSAFLINNLHMLQTDLPMIYMITGACYVVILPVVGKLSDKMDKYRLFTIGSCITIAMVLLYTNLSSATLAQVVIINVIMFSGIMSRMIPATTLNTSLPQMRDRGAFMSINASLSQIAGGIAGVCAGFIVYQPGKHSPLQNYNVLGFVTSGVILLCLYLVYRVSVLVKSRQAEEKPITVDLQPEMVEM